MRFKLSTVFVCLSAAIATSILAPTTVSALSQPSASSASSSTFQTSSFSGAAPTSTTLEAPTLTILDGEEPQITSPPEILSSDVDLQLQEKYHQTTYWSCVTIATQVHCGWHEPILNGGDEVAGARGKKDQFTWAMGLGVAVVGILLR